MGDQNSERWSVNRRTVLQSAASGSVLAGTVGSASASSGNGTITVKQGSQSYTLEPLSYENWSVEQFYSYGNPDGASANTPVGLEESGVSKLFAYEGPNGLSLVFIHDAADDYSGGSTTFDFNGLPASGSWVVPDDHGDGPNSSRADWDWAPCCTDGGAYRGGLDDGVQVTISPQFIDGIQRWVALSGSASSPDEVELDTSKPITITTGTTEEPTTGFAAVKEEKLALASEITALSPSIDETERVRATLDGLESQIEAGNVSESTAIDAVERMKLGENITESSIAALGPSVTETPERSDTLVGAPNGSPAADPGFDIAGETVENVLLLGVSFLAVGSALGRLAGRLGSLGSRIGNAIETTDDVLGTVFGAIPFLADRTKDLARGIKDHVVGKIESEGIESGARLYEIVAGSVQEYRDPVANDLLSGVEQDFGGTPFDDKLAEFDDDLGGDDGSLDLEGDQIDAENAAANGVDRVNDILRETKDEINVTKFVAGVGDVLAVAGTILTALSGGTLALIGVAAAIVGAFFSISFSFLTAVAGADGLFDVQGAHNDALDAIVSGTPEV